ncbi:hypothetical protein [Effusibacillus consociatus]|uniref:Uncharacterized protein n=1 Tax=Effusibacillus consociatus TaxID=1117041 RepID=A0ABV9Q6G4_9BACL
MSGNFFDTYKEFIVIPADDQKQYEEEFAPEHYAQHFIITLSLYDSHILCWREASKYEIEIEKSIQKVVEEFNQEEKGSYHLQILELDEDKPYFVLALSCKTKTQNEEEVKNTISYLLEWKLANALYVGEYWFRLIGEKGRIKRKLFSFACKEYTVCTPPSPSENSLFNTSEGGRTNEKMIPHQRPFKFKGKIINSSRKKKLQKQ